MQVRRHWKSHRTQSLTRDSSCIRYEVGLELTYDRILAAPNEFQTAARSSFLAERDRFERHCTIQTRCIQFVDQRDQASTAAGAVNTIHAVDGMFLGYNTDGIGLVADLVRLRWPLQHAKILVIGAGGCCARHRSTASRARRRDFISESHAISC